VYVGQLKETFTKQMYSIYQAWNWSCTLSNVSTVPSTVARKDKAKPFEGKANFSCESVEERECIYNLASQV
jgi:hypothetical protein